MRVWFSVLGVVAVLLGVPAGWLGEPATALAQGTAAGPTSADGVALGVIVDTTNPKSMEMAREAGFTHAKMIVHWPRLEPKRGQYTFAETPENDLDNVMKAARNGDVKLVVRVDGAPDWTGGSPSKADPKEVEAFYAAMAAHGKGTIVAYEILNEPNLPFEWGGAPSPSGYAAFLKAAYKGVKKGDPAALVIGGGLSPATGGAGGTIEDVDFLRGMYAAGVKGSMDAMAIHNYGGNTEPERDPGDCGICFRRAEIYRQVMVEEGDAATPIWATEFGWLLDPGRDMGQYDWMRVSADKRSRAGTSAQQAPPAPAAQPAPPPPAPGLATPTPPPATPAPELSPSPTPEAATPAPSTPSPSPAAGPAHLKVGKTDGTGANLRERPSTEARAIAILLDGTSVEVIGEDVKAEGITWRNVRTTASTRDDVTGWVAAQYLVP